MGRDVKVIHGDRPSFIANAPSLVSQAIRAEKLQAQLDADMDSWAASTATTEVTAEAAAEAAAMEEL